MVDYSGLIIGTLGVVLGFGLSILVMHPMRIWKDGYDAAKKIYSDWDKGYEDGWKDGFKRGKECEK